MEMQHRQLRWLVALWMVWCPTRTAVAAPNNTMSVTPTCTSGATITCSDETTRNNNISTPYNAHTHTDITAMSGVNVFTIGDNTSGNKDYCVDSATDRCLRWQEAVQLWTIQQNGTVYNEVMFSSGTAGLTPNAVLIGNGTGAIVAVANGTSGQFLQSNGASSAPSWAASTFSRFVGSFTHDRSLTANTSVTGVGFTPRIIIFTAGTAITSTNAGLSIGFDDGTTQEAMYSDDQNIANGWSFINNRSVFSPTLAGATDHRGRVASMDADGFTMAWNNTGSPTGTLSVAYVAFR